MIISYFLFLFFYSAAPWFGERVSDGASYSILFFSFLFFLFLHTRLAIRAWVVALYRSFWKSFLNVEVDDLKGHIYLAFPCFAIPSTRSFPF